MPLRSFFSSRWLVLACLLVLTSCSRLPHASRSTPSLVSLRLKWVFDPGFAGEMVADKAGIFAKHGLSMTLKSGGFEADPIKLVASGSDTFGVTGADSFLMARAQGIPVVAIAAGYLRTPVVFYTRESAHISGPDQLKGLRVGVQSGQDTYTVFQALLAHAGMTLEDVRQVPVKYDLSPFLLNRVQVWPGYAATQSYALTRQGVRFNELKPADFGVSYLGTVYFTSEKFRAEHPVLVQEFVASVIEGWQSVYTNSNAALQMIDSFDSKNLTADYTSFALAQQKPYIKPDGRRFAEYNADDWNSTETELLQTHVITSPVDIHSAVDFNDLARYYNQSAR